MKIELDLDKLVRSELCANEYLFLLLRLTGRQVPSTINDKVNLESLEERGFIKIVEGGFSKRPKLNTLFSNIIETATVEDWIDEWRCLWPPGIKSGGKLVRGSKAACLQKMKVFLARTGYSKEEVFAAAQAYVLERKHHRYNYMTISSYFIKKDDDSPLEAWCEQLKEDTTRTEDFGQFHKEI
jgi:hypothetical protein